MSAYPSLFNVINVFMQNSSYCFIAREAISKQAVVLTVSGSSSSLAFPYQKEGRIYSWQKSLLQTHKSFWTLRENVDSERHLLLWNKKHQIRHSLSWKGFERMANIDYQVYWCIYVTVSMLSVSCMLHSKHHHISPKKRVQLIYALCNQSILLKYDIYRG